MDPLDPRHGQYAGVQAHQADGTELCDPCVEARRKYQKRLTIDHARGQKRRVPNRMVGAHIKRLRQTGLSMREISELAGVSLRTVYRAVGADDRTTITVGNARKILAVQPTRPTKGWMPATGAVRRVRALIALGHPINELAARVGFTPQNMSTFAHASKTHRPQTHVMTETWRRIADVYDELCMTPGPSKRARTIGERAGWLPPLAWDDIDHDPEPATATTDDDLDEQAIWRRMQGDKTVRLTADEATELAKRWVAAGGTRAEMQRHTGVHSHRYLPKDGAA